MAISISEGKLRIQNHGEDSGKLNNCLSKNEWQFIDNIEMEYLESNDYLYTGETWYLKRKKTGSIMNEIKYSFELFDHY